MDLSVVVGSPSVCCGVEAVEGVGHSLACHHTPRNEKLGDYQHINSGPASGEAEISQLQELSGLAEAAKRDSL